MYVCLASLSFLAKFGVAKLSKLAAWGSSECSRAPRFLPTLEELSTRGNRQPDKLPMEGDTRSVAYLLSSTIHLAAAAVWSGTTRLQMTVPQRPGG